MNFKITTKKYVEQSNQINELTSVFTHASKDEEVKASRGQVFTVVNLKGPANLDAISATNIFLDRFETEYFSNSLESIPSVLEKATRIALFALNGFFEEKQLVGDDILFDFACVAIKEDILYIGKVESGNIYLIRNNKSLDLGKSLSDISNPKLVDYGSGELQAGDKIILANAVADEVITDWPLLSRYSEAEINRLIQPGMHGEEKMTFLIIEVDHDESNVEKRYIDSFSEENSDNLTSYPAGEGNETYFDNEGDDEVSKFDNVWHVSVSIAHAVKLFIVKLCSPDGILFSFFSQVKSRIVDIRNSEKSESNFSELPLTEKRSEGVKKLVTNLRKSNGVELVKGFQFKTIAQNKFVWGGGISFVLVFFL